MFKKNIVSTIIFIFLFFGVYIWEINALRIVSESQKNNLKNPITLWEMFMFFGEMYDHKIPESYKYIDVKIKWISKDWDLYKNIQKLIYVDVLDNVSLSLRKTNKISAYNFYRFAEKNYDLKLIKENEIAWLKSRKATFNDFNKLKEKLKITRNTINLEWANSKLSSKKKIFSDVYNTLSSSHYEKDKLDQSKMIEDATKALAESSWDKYTVYFPPVENKDFKESLNWKYEWIGAYVDMEKPWVFKIISPLPDSPAEKAWLKWWDIVSHVDGREIKQEDSIKHIISLIKWKAWTEVLLRVKRWNNTFDLKVKRWHITLKEIEAKKLNTSTYYIKMNFFWPGISKEFKNLIQNLEKDKQIKKIIFDLRWNGWWYLDQVSNILWNFVAKWEKTAVVKYNNYSQNYYSKWYDKIDFSKYRIIVLENWGTASASEIFIWTLKDYFPKTTVIWENSYGKGSVQTIKNYRDGSSLKYTIAKWYTWKFQNWIDGIWIKPDIEIKMEKYWVEQKDDKQLQRAINIR